MAKKTPEINSSSTADMAFLLLCFFMMTTTMDVDTGLERILPPLPKDTEQKEDLKILPRNLFSIKINSANKLLAGNKPMHVSELKEKVIEFLANPRNDSRYSEKEVKPIEGWVERGETKTYPVSKGIIALQNDRGTSYKEYIAVQNEIVKAINELRNEFTLQYFQKSFDKCSPTEQEIAKDAIPQKISEAEPKDISKTK